MSFGRELIAKWECDKEYGKVVRMLEGLTSNYYFHKKELKEREKWLEYVRISILIYKYKKPMKAYRMYKIMVQPNSQVEAIKVEYRRQRNRTKKEGYDVADSNHLKQVKEKWKIKDWESFY